MTTPSEMDTDRPDPVAAEPDDEYGFDGMPDPDDAPDAPATAAERDPRPGQRKAWHELSERSRRQYERMGHTQVEHDAGRPIPKDRPPARRRTAAPRTAPSAPARSKRMPLAEPLTELFTQVGTMLFLVDPFDGTVLIERSSDLAEQIDQIAERSPKVQRALEGALTGVSVFGIAGVVASIAIPIMIHHGMIPPGTPLDFMIPEEAAKYNRPAAPPESL